MSHVAKVDLVVKSLEHLKTGWELLGGQVLQQSDWRWYGRWVNDYSATDAAYHHGIKPEQYGKDAVCILRHKDASYDIGVYENPDKQVGGYVLVFDNYSGGMGIEKVAGKRLTGLKTEYGVAVASAHVKTLRQKHGGNWQVKRQVGKNGHVQVAISR